MLASNNLSTQLAGRPSGGPFRGALAQFSCAHCCRCWMTGWIAKSKKQRPNHTLQIECDDREEVEAFQRMLDYVHSAGHVLPDGGWVGRRGGMSRAELGAVHLLHDAEGMQHSALVVVLLLLLNHLPMLSTRSHCRCRQHPGSAGRGPQARCRGLRRRLRAAAAGQGGLPPARFPGCLSFTRTPACLARQTANPATCCSARSPRMRRWSSCR